MDQFVYQGFIATQPLWNNTQFGLKQFNFPTIPKHTNIKQSIPRKLRLGHQMEYVFMHLIQGLDTYEVVLHNQPVKSGNQSIGEIDFIIEEKTTKQHIHIELTYKFYLIDPDISEPIHRLMGPNRNDMFFRKMEKIKEHQFPLLRSAEALELLQTLQIDINTLEQQVCFKAQLFLPYGLANVNIRPLNVACISGFWLKFDMLKTASFNSFKFFIPRMLMDVNIRLLKENSPMVWMQKPDGSIEKVFVVWW